MGASCRGGFLGVLSPLCRLVSSLRGVSRDYIPPFSTPSYLWLRAPGTYTPSVLCKNLPIGTGVLPLSPFLLPCRRWCIRPPPRASLRVSSQGTMPLCLPMVLQVRGKPRCRQELQPPPCLPGKPKPFTLHQRTSLAQGIIQTLPYPGPLSPKDPIPQPPGRESLIDSSGLPEHFPSKASYPWPLPCSPPVCLVQAVGRPTPCWALTTSRASMFGHSMTCSEPSRRPAMTWNMRCPCPTLRQVPTGLG